MIRCGSGGIDSMCTLGEKVKERRKAKGWRLRNLSEESGVSITFLARIERGERFPSAAVLRKIAKPLGFTEVELFKMAGYLSRDDSDERVERIKGEVKEALAHLSRVIDGL